MPYFSRRPKSKFPFLIFAGAVVLGLWVIFTSGSSVPSGTGRENRVVLEVAGVRIDLDVADTLEKRQTGLSGKEELPPNGGMLFVFEEPGFYNFWMKDVNFPLDIIWISENWEIVDIDSNVLPSSYPATFTSSKPVLYVLEVNGGFVQEHQIKIGQSVKISDL